MALTDNIRFRQGSLAALGRQAISNGSLWFTTDEGAIYLDVNGSRVRFGDYITVPAVANLPTDGHAYETALYYAKAENVLARWDKTNSKWVQLNAAGLTKIVVNGNGNVLAGAQVTVDPETGAKVLTFNTASVATSEGLQQLQTRVQAVEAQAEANKKAIATLNGDANTAGSVAKAVADAKADLQAKIDAVDALADKGIADAAAAKTYAEGVQSNLNATNVRMEAAEGDISGLKGQVGSGTVDSRIDAAKTAVLGEANYAGTVKGAYEAAAAAKTAADNAKAAADEAQADANANAGDIAGLKTRMEAAEGDIDDLEAAVELLNGDDKTAGSVDYKIALEVAKILNDNDASDIDTLEEIAAWIKNDTAGVGSIVSRLDAVESKNQSQDTAIQGLDADIKANKTAAENAVSGLKTELLGDASTDYNTLGKLEDKVIAAQAQADKGVSDAASAKSYAEGVQSNLNATNVRVEGAESDISGLKSRMTAAEGEIDDLQAADTAIRGEFAAADTALKNSLTGDATVYTDLGKAEDAIQANAGSIQTINTNIEAINANLTWETFE